MENTHRLPVGIQHIVIAIGMKAVPAIVTCGRDTDAAAEHFLDDGDAPPARRAIFLAILQIHVDGRQRNDRDFGLGNKIERAVNFAFGLVRQAAAMTADDTAFVAVPHRGARYQGQGGGGRVVGLVDMKIDVKMMPGRERKHAVEQSVDIVERRTVIADRGARHAAEQAAGFFNGRRRPCRRTRPP